jgi:hypothetical protein
VNEIGAVGCQRSQGRLCRQTVIARALSPSAQEQMQQPGNQRAASESKRFRTGREDDLQTGRSAESQGGSSTRTVNKDLKVTGVLDGPIGMTRVTTIEPT